MPEGRPPLLLILALCGAGLRAAHGQPAPGPDPNRPGPPPPPCLPPHCVKLPPEADQKTIKLTCDGGAIEVEFAQYGGNCADCHLCQSKADEGNCHDSVVLACDEKKECEYTVCTGPQAAGPCLGQQASIGAAAAQAADPGNPGHGGDPAWGCPKEFEIRFSCGSKWGWYFLLLTGLGAGGYVGGFIGFNMKTKGLSGKEALPHQEFWLELKALVQDGVVFAGAKATELQKGDGGGGSAAGKEQLIGAAGSDGDGDGDEGGGGRAAACAAAAAVAPKVAAPAKVAAAVKGADSSSDSDSDLVE
jgi:hypothetical protein